MTQEEKELLLKDLCARLPYGVKCFGIHVPIATLSRIDVEDQTVYYPDCDEWEYIEYCKPYLRPMSSMTEEEKGEINDIITEFGNRWFDAEDANGHWSATFWESSEIVNYLNAHHFDYHDLIGKGLAIEAPEGMYKI